MWGIHAAYPKHYTNLFMLFASTTLNYLDTNGGGFLDFV